MSESLKPPLQKVPHEENTSSDSSPRLQSFLWLSIFSCFCPAFPVNLLALVLSILSRRSHEQGDFSGSRRLGRCALVVGVASVLIGMSILVVSVCVHYGYVD
ncbi:hypothetical protein WMY93_000090 [Mugilogobius chulae]|uniref:Transmembrane protein 233 n=1 Tax=Mugilogobius chulae TaxID=88201 RepID=A0AAW0Q152_9GOBI